ncbi:MAG: translational GTPase TypA [Nitrospinota bacterium]|nr:translational GTPase TypA [Nitrospinota bacterium]
MSHKEQIRNICVIAHVDHGKTTLIDALLKQSGTFRANEKVNERVMDANDLEKERGITIFSKNASIRWKNVKINIVDTPGHSDFGGEVERILGMVDSALLLVDAVDGPMPQTRFVLQKALKLGLAPIVVINKTDRPDARPDWVLNKVFDLFGSLGANDKQLEFHTVYSSAKGGFAMLDHTKPGTNMEPLLDSILEKVAPPEVDEKGTFQMLITSAEYSDYLGRMAIGKINRGSVKVGQEIARIDLKGNIIKSPIVKIFTFEGLNRKEAEFALAGDIVMLAGCKEFEIGETLADVHMPEPLPAVIVDKPTISMNFSPNTSPFAGRSGDKVTSRHLQERLEREVKSNLALKYEKGTEGDSFKVSGRGELHLSILIETMRREGYELSVSKPEVITHIKDGQRLEPEEFAIVDVDGDFAGKVIEKFGKRKGELKNMEAMPDNRQRLEFTIPARGLLGIYGELQTETKGTAVITHTFHNYIPWVGPIPSRSNGVLISMDEGKTSAYSLEKLSDRGELFIGPGVDVYEGMVVGECNRPVDMVVNVCRGKKLTNTRAAGNDDMIKLTPPRILSLEQTLEYLNDDELAEITPDALRIRKRHLKEEDRKRSKKVAASA